MVCYAAVVVLEIDTPRLAPAITSRLTGAEGHPTREEIEFRAYRIYVERGGAHGRDVDDWLQAEREVVEKYGKTGVKTKAAAV